MNLRRAFALAIFILLTALGLSVHKIGWDYLRSPHSEIVDMTIRPMPDAPISGGRDI